MTDADDVSDEGTAGRQACRPSWAGCATMPPKMMIETPLPMPFSVINSPIQTSNIVPAVIDDRMATVGRNVSLVEESEVR